MSGFAVEGQGSDQVLTPGSHGSIDHTAGPLNLLDTTAHNAVDHTAGPLNLLDGAAHDAVNHKAPPFNLLDQTAHDSLDHTGVPGVGGQVDRLGTISVPANTLTVNGDAIEYMASSDGVAAATAAVTLGGQTVATFSSVDNQPFLFTGWIIRTGPTAADVYGGLVGATDNGNPVPGYIGNVTLDWTSAHTWGVGHGPSTAAMRYVKKVNAP